MILPPPPVVLAYGIGVDSTALLIELHARGQAPDLVLTADTGNEKPATYAYLDVIGPWMRDRGIAMRSLATCRSGLSIGRRTTASSKCA